MIDMPRHYTRTNVRGGRSTEVKISNLSGHREKDTNQHGRRETLGEKIIRIITHKPSNHSRR